jgi:hypothetical protein
MLRSTARAISVIPVTRLSAKAVENGHRPLDRLVPGRTSTVIDR